MSETGQPPGDAQNFLQKIQAALGAGKEFSLESLDLAKRGGRELLSPLNAVFGDTLENTGSPLALPIKIYQETESGFGALDLDAPKDELHGMFAGSPQDRDGDRICIFIHGLGSSERTWEIRRKGASQLTSYSALLKKDTGHLCYFIRYNTGRHISSNGKDLADLLNQFARVYPRKIREINLIGHSMGGLVSRSAGYYGHKAGHRWIKKLTRNFLLGSPLLGAHQEQIGKLTTDVLNTIPLPGARITARFLDIRSAGIQDLGYGYLRDEDWQDPPPSRWQSWFTRKKTQPSPEEGGALKNRRNPVSLLKKTRYYLMIGSLSKDPDGIISNFLGDGVVNRWSARGAAGEVQSNYEQYGQHGQSVSREIPGLAHTAIPGDPRVYRQLRDWLRTPA